MVRKRTAEGLKIVVNVDVTMNIIAAPSIHPYLGSPQQRYADRKKERTGTFDPRKDVQYTDNSLSVHIHQVNTRDGNVRKLRIRNSKIQHYAY